MQNDQTNQTSSTPADLLALFEKAKGGVQPVISEISAEEYSEMANSVATSLFHVPYNTGKNVWRHDKGTVKVPCQITTIVYRQSLIKSTAKDSFGALIKAVSIDLLGYDTVRDADNNPVSTEVENPLKGQPGQPDTIRKYELITIDEDGNPLEPKKLMEFRPAFGLDTNKSMYNRPKDTDMLVLVPNQGVPRKKREKKTDDATSETETQLEPAQGVTADQAKQSSTTIAWELIPGLEEAMKKPLRNALLMNNTVLLDFIANIPTASNAPSKKAEGGGKRMPTGGGSTAKQASAEMPDDAFAGAPES